MVCNILWTERQAGLEVRYIFSLDGDDDGGVLGKCSVVCNILTERQAGFEVRYS